MKKTRTLKITLWTGCFLTFFFYFVGTGVADEHSFKAELKGSEEKPPVQTEGRGRATFFVPEENDQITFNVFIKDVENVTGISINNGKRGEEGPPVANLFLGPKREGRLTNLFSEGSIRSYQLLGPLEGSPIEALIDMVLKGNAYVNVHTEQHPDGEIRGQIIDP